MNDRPAAPPELRSLVSELFGVERELAQQGSSLAQQGAGDASAWLMLVEQAAARLRSSAQRLEEAIVTAAPATPGGGDALRSEDETALSALFSGAAGSTDDEAGEEESPAAAERPLSSAEGVLAGHAAVVPVSELLGFLSGLRKTGMLWVDTPRESFLLQLQEGAVIYAHGDNPPQGQLLGEILVRNEALERDKLAWALVESTAGKDVLGGHLVRKGLISQEELTRALAEQVQMIFDRLFSSADATYQFELEGRLMDSADVRLNVIQLLLESARANDECRQRVEAGVGVPLAKAP
jgi:hypothetical protein